MQHDIEHGNEPARFPCIETERALSRAQGLMRALKKDLPEIWQRDMAKDILGEIGLARTGFSEVLRNNRDQRMRLIELASSPDVI